MTASRMLIEAILPGQTASQIAAMFSGNTGQVTGRPGFMKLLNLLTQVGASMGRAKLRIGLDTATAKAATGTITIVYATTLVGEWVQLSDGAGTYRLTCVTSGTPVNGDGTFLKVTDLATTAENFIVAWNSLPGLKNRWLATRSTGVVTITAINDQVGLSGNAAKLAEGSATGLVCVSPSGGLDFDTKVAVTFTITDVTTAGDTLTIGGVVLTAAAAAANQDEFTIGASAGATATAIAACINANTALKGLIVATASGTSTGIVTMTLQQGGRIGKLIALLESCSVGSLSATSFVAPVADVWASTPVSLLLGVP